MTSVPRTTRLALLLAVVVAGCGHGALIPGTVIPDSEDNRKIVETIETYRLRLLERNVEGLLILASPSYFEDSGTPAAKDDYGYAGLQEVLNKRLARTKAIRYDIEYRTVTVRGARAEVEVFLDGSFELRSEAGDRYHRVNDYWRFVLERSGDKWLFLSGM